MTEAEAVKALNAIDIADQEAAHVEADAILEQMVTDPVFIAYRDLSRRCRWWVYA